MYKTIRVDIKHLEEKVLIEKTKEIIDMEEVYEAYIVVETAKKSGKRHIQGILKVGDDKKNHNKIRNIIRNKLLDKKGSKEDYSYSDVKNFDNYMKYLQKGEYVVVSGQFVEGIEPEEIYCKGFSREALIEFRDKVVEDQKEFIEKIEKQKSKSMNEIFLDWFEDNKLSNYKQINNKYYFNSLQMLRDIREFYRLKKKDYENVVLDKKMNLLYNCIVYKYDREAFERYELWVHREVPIISKWSILD